MNNLDSTVSQLRAERPILGQDHEHGVTIRG